MNSIQISNVTIRQTENNLYNLNDLHKAAGGADNHKPSNWLRISQTQELIAEIEAQGGVAVTTSQGGKNRGTFVCKELVYAYATWISAKFFLLVIRTFDAVVSGSLKIAPKTTSDDRTPLRNAVNMLVVKKGLNYSEAYKLIHQRFAVGSLDELSQAQLSEAVEYVHRVLMGEVLDKPAKPMATTVDDELVLAIGRLLFHAQDMRLFVKRYLSAFCDLGLSRSGALWSFVHETEPTFKMVRSFFLEHNPQNLSALTCDATEHVKRQVIATAAVEV
ncbi:KilA-N domain-containing protein [Kingella negevensis]|uniref:KilA-N domain-containing protein n=1 Tax=Kingella negevensis TaxID=1522312 RepID=UPI002543F46E|nr:KilA-N domain-containing protein [Kingella negevensis]WII93197.1 KilA-N domain-containing protein [Kingella negevensis]